MHIIINIIRKRKSHCRNRSVRSSVRRKIKGLKRSFASSIHRRSLSLSLLVEEKSIGIAVRHEPAKADWLQSFSFDLSQWQRGSGLIHLCWFLWKDFHRMIHDGWNDLSNFQRMICKFDDSFHREQAHITFFFFFSFLRRVVCSEERCKRKTGSSSRQHFCPFLRAYFFLRLEMKHMCVVMYSRRAGKERRQEP